MALQLICGPAGSDRTRYIYETICTQAREHPKNRYLFLVPEQSALQVQRALTAVHPEHVLGNIDVVSFVRLAHRVLEELGIPLPPLLDDTGKSMILRRTAGKWQSKLQLFQKNLNQSGFVAELKSILSELVQYGISPQSLKELQPRVNEQSALGRKLADLTVLFDAFRRELGDTYITAEELMAVFNRVLAQSRYFEHTILILDGFTGFTPLQYQVLEQLLTLCTHVAAVVTCEHRLYQELQKRAAGQEYRRPAAEELFFMSWQMAEKLIELSSRQGKPQRGVQLVDWEECANARKTDAKRQQLLALRSSLFGALGSRVEPEVQEGAEQAIRLLRAPSPREELRFVLQRSMELVREEHYRWMDIAVVTGDLGVYQPIAEELLKQAGIPYFIDQRETLAHHPLTELVEALLLVIEERMSYESVMGLLRNLLVSGVHRQAGGTALEPASRASIGFTREEVDRLENYLLACSIRGFSAWEQPWERIPRGGREEELLGLNQLRLRLLQLIGPLRALFAQKATVRRVAEGLFWCLQQLQVSQGLREMADYFEQLGELQRKSLWEQVYARVLELLDQFVDLMGEQQLDARSCREVLSAGFGELQAGLLPPTIDRLMVGDLLRSRLNEVKVLFLVGVNDGILPKLSNRGGVLNEQDREQLKRLGLELAPTAREDVFTQKYYVYLAVSRPSKQLLFTYSENSMEGRSLRPSYLMGLVRRVCPWLKTEDTQEQYPGLLGILTPQDGRELMVQGLRRALDKDQTSWWRPLYHLYQAKAPQMLSDQTLLDQTRLEGVDRLQKSESLEESECSVKQSFEMTQKEQQRLLDGLFFHEHTEQLDRELAKQLFSGSMTSQVTRLEQYAACEYAHFLKYGLRLKPRELFVIQAADYGTLFHGAIEAFFLELKKEGRAFRGLTDEERSRLVSKGVELAVKEYSRSVFESSSRNQYRKQRVERVAQRTVWALQKQWERGLYELSLDEVHFSRESQSELTLELRGGEKLYLQGRIDRVDLLEQKAEVYVKIIDYKTGSTQFDYTKLAGGLQLQLLLYLQAVLEQQGEQHPGQAVIPAGVYYYNIKDPIVRGVKTKEEVELALLKELRMNGLTNADASAYQSIDSDPGKSSLVVKGLGCKKDGTLTARARAAEGGEIRRLALLAQKKAASLAQQMYDGWISRNPYEYQGQNPCQYCDFREICTFDSSRKDCQYRRLWRLSMEEAVRLLDEEGRKDK